MGMITKKNLVLLAVVFGLSAQVSAQSRRSGRQVVRLGEETVEGSVQKPELCVHGTPESQCKRAVGTWESFLPRIVESVEKKPF